MADCKHFWIVDSKNFGTCKYCGETRDFAALLRTMRQSNTTYAEKGGEVRRRGRPRKVQGVE